MRPRKKVLLISADPEFGVLAYILRVKGFEAHVVADELGMKEAICLRDFDCFVIDGRSLKFWQAETIAVYLKRWRYRPIVLLCEETEAWKQLVVDEYVTGSDRWLLLETIRTKCARKPGPRKCFRREFQIEAAVA